MMSDLPALTIATIWAILNDTLDDATVNAIVWHCLGYRQQIDRWDNSNVATEWRESYPEPPDLIGSRPAIVRLTRSIPEIDKQLLKQQLGFQGYKVNELVPRKTRRATIANWLLSYMKQAEIDSATE